MPNYWTTQTLPPEMPARRETSRLDCLRELGILGSGADLSIDNIVECTAFFFGVPMALATLVDRDYQCFKSRYGLEGEGTPRSASFCQYTIRQRGVFCVPDARHNPIFRNFDVVTGEPYVRFYAGAPIMIRGEHAIGGLCILDQEPNAVPSSRLGWLKHFASILAHTIEMNYLREDEKLVRSIISAQQVAGSA